MFLNNEMNRYLRYAALKSRSKVALEYFATQHVLSSYTSFGGVPATLPWYTYGSFVIALVVSLINRMDIDFLVVPPVYEGFLWVFFILALVIQMAVTPGFLHPIVTPELIEKLSGGSEKSSSSRNSSRPATKYQEEQPKRPVSIHQQQPRRPESAHRQQQPRPMSAHRQQPRPMSAHQQQPARLKASSSTMVTNPAFESFEGFGDTNT
jgi:hypothetical protein